MESEIVDDIMQNLFHTLRLIHRKLLKADLEDSYKDISHQHFAVMGMLAEVVKLPVSTIGNRLLIPKPQMTHLIDKLISLGIVERLPDTEDRRIINISLTDQGREVLMEARKSLKSNIIKKLSCLKDEEVEELSSALRKLRHIGSKLE
jgi:DNA-binding MarR family transcriptional regulator